VALESFTSKIVVVGVLGLVLDDSAAASAAVTGMWQ